MCSIYFPAEDSFLLQKYVEKFVYGKVLDMGTGSGIQAVTAAKKNVVQKVVAVDINLEAIEVTKKFAIENNVSDKITVFKSNLFEKICGKFDWILFNPPYLPSEKSINDSTWDGGETGKELISSFLNQAKKYLNENGQILIIYSSLTGINQNYGYDWIVLEEQNLFFENLFCALLKPLINLKS
ncbi:methyltransferase [Candidatus Bathyarchaeota archaeon]|nr:methyltransferase [Candidatus Bathyarchaeota archaeon]